jgi:hypothetical protein
VMIAHASRRKVARCRTLVNDSPQNALSPRRQFQRTRSFWTSGLGDYACRGLSGSGRIIICPGYAAAKPLHASRRLAT